MVYFAVLDGCLLSEKHQYLQIYMSPSASGCSIHFPYRMYAEGVLSKQFQIHTPPGRTRPLQMILNPMLSVPPNSKTVQSARLHCPERCAGPFCPRRSTWFEKYSHMIENTPTSHPSCNPASHLHTCKHQTTSPRTHRTQMGFDTNLNVWNV